MDIYSKIGSRLKELRGKKSQAAFAKDIGIPFRSYRRYETGETIAPIHVLEKVAEKYGTTVGWLIKGMLDIEADTIKEEVRLEGEDVEIVGEKYKLLSEYALSNLYRMLRRIWREGDTEKLEAIRAQLRALDPGEEK